MKSARQTPAYSRMGKVCATLLLAGFLYHAIGASIGNNSNGNTSDNFGPNAIVASKFTASSSFNATTIKIKIASGSGKIKLAMYADNNGIPGSFLMGSNELINPASGWQSLSLTSALSISSGQTYWFAASSDGSLYASADNVTNGSSWVDAAYGTWPASFPAATVSNFSYCILAEDGVTPPPPPPPLPNTLTVAGNTTYQTIKGFGANINVKHWDNGALKAKCLDQMIDDMGCTMFRTDAWGQSNWLDPDNSRGASCLNQTRYNEVYAWPEFTAAKEFCLYLNQKGLEPYVNISGYVSEWMRSPGTWTLAKTQYDNYAEMCRSYVKWLKDSGVKFKYFNATNENDLPPREGPGVAEGDLPLLTQAVVNKFVANGLSDIKFIGPEASNPAYGFDQLVAATALAGKIGFSCHSYSGEMPAWFYDDVKNSVHGNTEVWMGEFGSLSQGSTDDIARVIYINDILIRSLLNGCEAAMTWDAFSNYHWHDNAWTEYGVYSVSPSKNDQGLYSGGTYTPKLRYYGLKQVYKYVKPGFVRCGTAGGPGLTMATFRNSDKTKVTIVGSNTSGSSKTFGIKLNDFSAVLAGTNLTIYRTSSASEKCQNVGTVTLSSNLDCSVTIPNNCVFTITNADNGSVPPPTPTIPASPALSSPSNGATALSTTPTLSWSASSGATSYRCQVSTSSAFSSTIYDQSNLTGTSASVSGLSNSTTYYWRVNATNSAGTSSWSTVFSFTTAAVVIPPPGGDADLTNLTGNTITARGENGTNEGMAKAFDNSTSSKWLDFSPAPNRASWITCQFGSSASYRVNSYKITSANDAPERDPHTWALRGSIDGATWTKVDTQTAVIFSGRGQTRAFTVATPGSYKYYKLDISRVNNPASANCIQLAEIELWGASGSSGGGSTWTGSDIGAVAAAGSWSLAGSTYTVKGSGADIWNTADGFYFVYQQITGNKEIIARVASQTNSNVWAKAGVMIRETLGANALYATMVTTPSNGNVFQRRITVGGSSSSTAGRTSTAPTWVRLVRSGTTITAYDSQDGVTWATVGSVSIAMTSTVYIGLAVTSHADGTISTATFDNVIVR